MAKEQLIDNLLSLYHLIRHASHPSKRGEITPEQYWLLRRLHRMGSQSIGQLAEALGITSSSTTTACKRLEKAGLVIRERQSDDERMVRVHLTETGRERIAIWERQRRDLLAALIAPLAPHEQDALQGILMHLLQAAEDTLRKEKEHAEDYRGT